MTFNNTVLNELPLSCDRVQGASVSKGDGSRWSEPAARSGRLCHLRYAKNTTKNKSDHLTQIQSKHMQLQALPCASSLHLRVPDLVVFRKWDS